MLYFAQAPKTRRKNVCSLCGVACQLSIIGVHYSKKALFYNVKRPFGNMIIGKCGLKKRHVET
jgi:hypothetical protein